MGEVGRVGAGVVGLVWLEGRVVVGTADQRVLVVGRSSDGDGVSSSGLGVGVEVWLGFGCGALAPGGEGRRVLVGDEGGGVRMYRLLAEI